MKPPVGPPPDPEHVCQRCGEANGTLEERPTLDARLCVFCFDELVADADERQRWLARRTAGRFWLDTLPRAAVATAAPRHACARCAAVQAHLDEHGDLTEKGLAAKLSRTDTTLRKWRREHRAQFGVDLPRANRRFRR